MTEIFPGAGGVLPADASARAPSKKLAIGGELFPDTLPLMPADDGDLTGLDDDDHDLAPSDAMAEARRRIQTDGVTAAVEALIDVCRDAKAPAPAKASAGAALLRAAGLFTPGEEGGAGKGPSEMSAEELQAAVARLRRDLRAK